MPYEFMEEIATADVAFRAHGKTMDEMFLSAAEATMNVMVGELHTIEAQVERTLVVESESIEMLLFELLQELIFQKDAHRLLLRLTDIEIQEEDGRYRLAAKAYGEELDMHRHDLIVDVKAVTLHKYRVEETPEGWEALVILDI